MIIRVMTRGGVVVRNAVLLVLAHEVATLALCET